MNGTELQLDKYLNPIGAPINGRGEVTSFDFNTNYDRSAITARNVRDYGLTMDGTVVGLIPIQGSAAHDYADLPGVFITRSFFRPSKMTLFFNTMAIGGGGAGSLSPLIDLRGAIDGSAIATFATRFLMIPDYTGDFDVSLQQIGTVGAGVHTVSVQAKTYLSGGFYSPSLLSASFQVISFGN